ncbi:MAG: hypothetical protein R6V26_04835, partial [Roseovarius sp.]
FIGGHSLALAETRAQYLYTVDCAASFMKVAMILRGKRAVGETFAGQLIEPGFIDHFEQMAEEVLDFLFVESSFSEEAKPDLHIEMAAFTQVFENGNPDTVRRVETLAFKNANTCRDQFRESGWFSDR